MDIYGIALHSALERRKHLAAVLAVQLQNPLLSSAAAKTGEQIFVVDRIIQDLEMDILKRCATSGPKEVQLDHDLPSGLQSQDPVHLRTSQALHRLSFREAHPRLW
jgi:hypothetical protein